MKYWSRGGTPTRKLTTRVRKDDRFSIVMMTVIDVAPVGAKRSGATPKTKMNLENEARPFWRFLSYSPPFFVAANAPTKCENLEEVWRRLLVPSENAVKGQAI